ncbi:MAG TPA: hypothetical protein VK841_07755, partial [Polyangiaceae bacterium]|nr:hypothetical protein [Polyangiaceae bacterium]
MSASPGTASGSPTRRGSLNRDQRAGSARETALRGMLGIATLLLASAYALALLYLVLRGGAKVVSFTAYAMPLAGVDHEDVMRGIVAACFFGGAAYCAIALLRVATTRGKPWTARTEQ